MMRRSIGAKSRPRTPPDRPPGDHNYDSIPHSGGKVYQKFLWKGWGYPVPSPAKSFNQGRKIFSLSSS